MRFHNRFFLLLLSMLLVLLLFSCYYKEGPAISFRSVANRMDGQYTVEGFWINDVDCTGVYNDKCSGRFSFGHERDTYVVSLRDCKPDGRGIAGYFDFKNKNRISIGFSGIIYANDSIIQWDSSFTYFGPIGNRIISEWTILKLKDTEMKLESTYQGNLYTLNLVE
jgi:hypothetical protein